METISAESMKAAYEKRQEEAAKGVWDGIDDAFRQVRDLVEGEAALIDAETYRQMRGIAATVRSRVSLVKASQPWAFFALRGMDSRTPQWLMVTASGQCTSDLPEICRRLRLYLAGAESLDRQPGHDKKLGEFADRLEAHMREMLPNRKLAALDLLDQLLPAYCDLPRHGETADLRQAAEALRDLLDGDTPDMAVDIETLAQAALDVFMPILAEKRRTRPKRNRTMVGLRDLRPDLLATPLAAQHIERIMSRVGCIDRLDRRCAAVILGLAD
jgi:hypothetical protein